ncbi:unnamed protein product, partial [Rotaria magnacalcarata]
MDTTRPPYSEDRFNEITLEVIKCMQKIGYQSHVITIIPMSGFYGDNLVQHSDKMPWFQEFNLHYKISDRLERDLCSATQGLEKTLSQVDLFSVTRFLQETAMKIRNKTMDIHRKKLESFKNGGP